jgi:hypothetical protein
VKGAGGDLGPKRRDESAEGNQHTDTGHPQIEEAAFGSHRQDTGNGGTHYYLPAFVV